MATAMYKHLKERFSVLKNVFLPEKFSPTGDYEDDIFEKTRAYRALTHAELEYYFEQIGMTIAKDAYTRWNATGETSKALIALATYYSGTYASIPDQKGGNNSSADLCQRVNKAFTEYCCKTREENNGIKEKNLLKLFLPVGIEITSLSDELLVAVNNYGTSRGEIVHTTRSAKNKLTPEDALTAATDLLNLVLEFDKDIEPIVNNDRS